MADSTSKSSKPKNPNFYEAAAQMSGAAGGAGTGGGTAGGASSAPMQEKVSNVQALLEVFKKMDKLEQDAEAKALIQQMSDIAQTYLTKIQGKGGSATAGAMPPATGAGATPPPPPEPTTSVPAGAGAGMGT